jgi:hypothetical protein
MKLYTFEELEKFTKKDIKNILTERAKMCGSLLNDALIGKTIESEGNDEEEEPLNFKIKEIIYHPSKELSINEKFIAIPVNIYLEDYNCTTKAEIIYENETTDFSIKDLLQEQIIKGTRFSWRAKRLQGLDYINIEILIPNALINPDIKIFNEYNDFITTNQKVSSVKKIKHRKELEKKLALEIEELKYQKFNIVKESGSYVPEDKEELMQFIHHANRVSFDKQALVEVMKKYSDNKEIVEAILAGFYEDIFKYASNRLKNDRDFIESCLDKKIVTIMEYVCDKFKDDDVLIHKAVTVNGSVIEHASERLKDDKNIALIAVGNNLSGDSAYFSISENLKKDKDIILKLVETRGDFFAVCPEVETNKELLIKAFSTAFDRQSSNLLRNTSEELRNDKEVALAAIKCNPDNIYHIGEKLKKEIGSFDPYTYLSRIDLYNEINEEVINHEVSPKRKMKM